MPETQAATTTFDDFETFGEAMAGWDLDWRQLDAGPLRATLSHLACGPAQVGSLTFNRSFLQRGTSPPGITFGVPGLGPEFEWCGTHVDEGHLLRFLPEAEYEAVTDSGFAGHSLSFDQTYFHDLANTLGVPDVSNQLVGGFRAWRTDGHLLHAVRSLLQSVYDEMARRPATAGSTGLANELTFNIPAAILEAVAAGTPTKAPSPRLRTQGFQRAMMFIESHTGDPLTVLQVSRASGVSCRTLNYAFRETLGLTMERYLKVRRLHGMRRDLRWSGPEATISDIANRWGFWHLGQLAADYRAQFGELPSATKQRPSPASAATA